MKLLSVLALVLFVSANSFAEGTAAEPAAAGAAPAKMETAAPAKAEKKAHSKKKKHSKKAKAE